MNDNSFMKIFSVFGFVVLAGISCWATEQSLHLLWPWMPELFVWCITVAFFVVASLGTKLIVDSLSSDYMENRKVTLIGGVILTLVFWLITSMPTNTHTFFYNKKINDVAIQDINTTNKYLGQIKNRVVTLPEWESIEKNVDDLTQLMTNEFNGISATGKRGNGPYTQELITKIGIELDPYRVFPDPRINSVDPYILINYQNNIKESKARKKIEFQAPKASVDDADKWYSNLLDDKDTITALMSKSEINEQIIKQTEGELHTAYAIIKSNSNFVNFEEEDLSVYTDENLETRTIRMLSVVDVWMDFFSGKYPASFAFWILLSILVDVAAFIFFDIAFKKQD